jgi:uncharacterized membrane protein YcaP (DUF421 family)
MFHLSLPVVEKILRPVIVYLVLVAFLRIFGKRELAQLNPFDLVVLLSLSNTVQNAIIGDDNSVSGGVIGALSLLSINWLLTRFLYRAPGFTKLFQGTQTTLILDGTVDHAALRREALTEEELLSVLHKQSFDTVEEVRRCVLEPNGTFFIEAKKPDDQQRAELMAAIQALSADVAALHAELRAR